MKGGGVTVGTHPKYQKLELLDPKKFTSAALLPLGECGSSSSLQGTSIDLSQTNTSFIEFEDDTSSGDGLLVTDDTSCLQCFSEKGGAPYISKCHHVAMYLTQPYILKGYRVDHRWSDAAASLFTLHNETWNVWSHLVLFLFFLWRTVVFLFHPGYSASWLDKLPFIVFLLSVQVCALASVAFHLFSCVSEKASLKLCACDFAGILILIGGSYISGLYYGFFCMQLMRHIYIGVITAVTVFGAYCSCCSWFYTYEFRHLRIGVFGGLAGLGIVPTIHWVLTNDFHGDGRGVLLHGIVAMYSLYACGLIFYVSRFPERHFPGLFDIFLSSHQIWHLFVALGAYVFYRCLENYSVFRIQSGC